ncbi:hypothetical protein BBK82_37345 [Lentzea guizhouensis]|uniref:Uncharacterized protein n=1 Tax=Lentzea guizhouensis TaxID=1586287 RepID=A0A1B2HSV2_9PSEU|nr:hypothetical protein [Lentzea guizhouensis]ANZ40816.1 hypothetical protein BBK82_37345 [Lentzea guizhouensis]
MADSSATTVRCHAEQTEVTLRSRTVLLDFTGECRVRGTALSDLRLSADLPDAGGPEDGGTVVLTQDGERLTAVVTQPDGEVRLTSEKAVGWKGSGSRFEADEEFVLVLEEAPDAPVLSVRGLKLQVENG